VTISSVVDRLTLRLEMLSSAEERRDPEVVVSLGDSILYESDLSLLRDESAWLNDHCILFWNQFCELKRFPSLLNSKNGLAVFLQPGTAFSMQFLDVEDLMVDSEGNPIKKIPEAKLVMIPLVSGAGAVTGGGSHWTLLVFDKDDKNMYHLDSSFRGSMTEAAVVTAQKLNAITNKSRELVTLPCAQQMNSFDCGVHVCSNAYDILLSLESFDKSNGETFSVERDAKLSPSVEGRREEIFNVANRMRREVPFSNPDEADD